MSFGCNVTNCPSCARARAELAREVLVEGTREGRVRAITADLIAGAETQAARLGLG